MFLLCVTQSKVYLRLLLVTEWMVLKGETLAGLLRVEAPGCGARGWEFDSLTVPP